MTTDRLFVIMLVMLIPMTGCFGAVDNADAQDDTTENNRETNYNIFMAEWQSGHAADCNSVNIGSIPFSASI